MRLGHTELLAPLRTFVRMLPRCHVIGKWRREQVAGRMRWRSPTTPSRNHERSFDHRIFMSHTKNAARVRRTGRHRAGLCGRLPPSSVRR